MCIRDRVYTDILAGNLAGMKTILLQIPEIKESKFFQFKRAMEKPIRLSLIHILSPTC